MHKLATRFLNWFDDSFEVFVAGSLIALGILFVLLIVAGILEALA